MNRQRPAVAANVPLFNVELDDGRCCERPASVFLILDLVMITFGLEHPIPRMNPSVSGTGHLSHSPSCVRPSSLNWFPFFSTASRLISVTTGLSESEIQELIMLKTFG